MSNHFQQGFFTAFITILLSWNAFAQGPIKGVNFSFQGRLRSFVELADNFDHECGYESQKDLKEYYSNLRNRYKEIELFALYLEPSFVANHINSVQQVDLEAIKAGKAEGFTALDYLLYEAKFDRKLVQKVSAQLKLKSKELQGLLVKHTLSEQDVANALRQSMLLQMGVGLENLDCRYSKRGAKDVAISLNAMQEAVSILGTSEEQQMFRDGINKAVKSLEKRGSDFNAAFYSNEYLAPLYAMLLGME